MSGSATRACVILIGNELLSGRTQDKNLAWLAGKLNNAGVRLREARVIPDTEEAIVTTVRECRSKFDYVFTTGGIGPTHDDITAVNIAKAFGVKLARHPEAERLLRAHYTPDQLNEARLKMADIPEGARLIFNPVSAAPGFIIGNVYVMAGVPVIMQAMFDSIRHTIAGGAMMLSRSLTVGVAEGAIAKMLGELQAKYPGVEIGSYPYFRQGELGTSLVLRCTEEKILLEATAELRNRLFAITGNIVEDK